MGVFHFKNFDVNDCACGMKICSDSVLLAAWFLRPYVKAHTILDVGTGSGVLALLAAEICPDASIVGVEIEGNAYYAAKSNFEASPWSSRLKAVHVAIGDFTIDDAPEIIISNPPYFINGETSANNARSTARHQQGLTFATLLKLPLAPDGHLGMVTPADAYDSIIFEAEIHRRKLCRLCRICTAPGKEPSRLLWDFSTIDRKIEETTLHLRNPDGDYSEGYRQLVENYYQKLPQR